MQDTLELFVPIPQMKTIRQKIAKALLGFVLAYGFLAVALLVWCYTNAYIALFTLPLGYLLMGIVSSKFRELAVPKAQREFHYGSFDLAAWVVGYYAQSV